MIVAPQESFPAAHFTYILSLSGYTKTTIGEGGKRNEL